MSDEDADQWRSIMLEEIKYVYHGLVHTEFFLEELSCFFCQEGLE